MKKIVDFFRDNILFICTCFLLAFIPLYPKLPLVGVSHTWVYVRAEDFLVSALLTLWIFLVLFRKVKLKTPLTVPILLFWVIGAISTFHGVLILFPTLANVFSNVALFSFLRRVEYISLFLVAYSSIRDKKSIYPIIAVLTLTLVSVIFYGLGQRYLGFPAFLTGNEEFAKGTPLTISALGRITSTFAGHYDLAAYLVLVVPIFVSLVFGFKNLIAKVFFLLVAVMGFWLVFMTVSRVSFFVLALSILILLILQKKRIIIIFFAIVTGVFLILSPSLVARFGNTVKPIDVLVDSHTGMAVGQVKEVPREYLKDKIVLRQNALLKDAKLASTGAVIPYSTLPDPAEILIAANAPNGENLPQGTGYINLSLSPIVKRTDQYFVEKIKDSKISNEVHSYIGSFLIKKARAYDLSFTTRFQGEWPRTFDAFKRNILVGSGYGSVSLAVDNNYLRILGETGALGFILFLSLFLISGIYILKALPKVDSPVVKSFVMGFMLGTLGLLLNATLIDVFEASKIAFSYWILMGFVLGILHFYNSEENVNIYREVKKVLTSPYAVLIYFFIITVALLFPASSNYFVGDDFTWLRWASESKQNVFNYFTQSNGFFYRPGARLYFSLMYNLFWLNQTFYHFVSIILDFTVVSLLFLIFRKIYKDYFLAIIGVGLFLTLSAYHEVIFWISSTGFLFTSVFSLLGLLLFIYWKEQKKKIYIILSLVSVTLSLFFHELGIISPLLLIAYDFVLMNKDRRASKKIYALILSPILPYLFLRFISNSHWLSGDYNYNFLKLPYNVIGNIFGYFSLDLLGPQSFGIYENLRNMLKDNLAISTLGFVGIIFILWVIYKNIHKLFNSEELRIFVFGLLFFIIALLPFLGLGNESSRYSYLASVGFVIMLSLFVKKSFAYLLTIAEKYSAVMIAILLALTFTSFQLFQLQKVHSDWFNAGKLSEMYLISFQDVYKDYWIGKPMHFYFVNVPIKTGDAWVFPVGLNDALWFILQNDNIKVDEVSSVSEALSIAGNTPNSEVILFDRAGVREIFSTVLPTNKK